MLLPYCTIWSVIRTLISHHAVDFDANISWTTTVHSQESFPCSLCHWSCHFLWAWGKYFVAYMLLLFYFIKDLYVVWTEWLALMISFNFFVTSQVIDMIANLYENQFPMRFGVILYSTTVIEKAENNGWENLASASSTDEDISSLVLNHMLLCLLNWFSSAWYGNCFSIFNYSLLSSWFSASLLLCLILFSFFSFFCLNYEW